MTERPVAGDVWSYPYLWAWQEERGETEGRKPRPVAVAIALTRRDGQTDVVLLAITSQRPTQERVALEVPDTEKRRAGLNPERSSWIVLDEYNSDVIERSFYLIPEDRLGQFSARFLRHIQLAFRDVVRMGSASNIARADPE